MFIVRFIRSLLMIVASTAGVYAMVCAELEDVQRRSVVDAEVAAHADASVSAHRGSSDTTLVSVQTRDAWDLTR